jgi:hypothetical protein
MNEWQLASIIVIGLVTVIGFIFHWGWNVIQETKKSIHSRIGSLETDMNILSDKGSKTHEELYRYMDNIFVRKDVHSVEYHNLIAQIHALELKIDKYFNGK